MEDDSRCGEEEVEAWEGWSEIWHTFMPGDEIGR